MGSILFNFLGDSLLFDKSLIDRKFDGVPDAGLEIELRRYREFCLENLGELYEEVAPERGRVRIYTGPGAGIRLLKQGAFYLDTVILPDPLFAESEPQRPSAIAWDKALGMPSRKRIDRDAITRAARLMFESRPMVAMGYVRYFPTAHYSEAPQEIPIIASDCGFEDALPQRILSIYQAAAEVRSLVSTPDGLLIQKDLSVGRRIHIDFDPAAPGHSYAYNLAEQEVSNFNDAERTFEALIRIPAEPPTEDTFRGWVKQSINQSAINHFASLDKEVRWSARFGAQYLTRSGFSASVLDASCAPQDQSIAGATTSGLLNLDLDFFQDVSIERLMDARSDTAAFERFRLLLEKNFRELRLENDAEKRALKTQNAMHELLEVQRTEVDRAIKRIRRKAAFGVVGSGLSLAASVPTGGFSLLGLIVAGFSGYKCFEEYLVASKESPGYFLWKARRPR